MTNNLADATEWFNEWVDNTPINRYSHAVTTKGRILILIGYFRDVSGNLELMLGNINRELELYRSLDDPIIHYLTDDFDFINSALTPKICPVCKYIMALDYSTPFHDTHRCTNCIYTETKLTF